MPATCIVRGCKSRSYQGCGIKYCLPWRDEMLCKQWLIEAGKSELELTEKQMSQFKNARMCSLHFNTDGEGTSTTLPSRTIPDFERQEAAAGLVQLDVSHMESNQRNVYDDVIITQPSLITPGRTPSQKIKRKLLSDSASQVTPKRKTTSIYNEPPASKSTLK